MEAKDSLINTLKAEVEADQGGFQLLDLIITEL